MIKTRRVGSDDVEPFLELSRAFHKEDGHPLTEAGEVSLRGVAGGLAAVPSFLLLDGETTIGFFILSFGYNPSVGPVGFIANLYLVPKVRGRGLGKQALALATEEGRKTGVQVLLLEVEARNDRAFALYESMGFVDTGRRLMVLPV